MQQQFEYDRSDFPPLHVPTRFVGGNDFDAGNGFAVGNGFPKLTNEAVISDGDPLNKLFNAIKDLQNQNTSIKEELSQIRFKYVNNTCGTKFYPGQPFNNPGQMIFNKTQDQTPKNFTGCSERLAS